MPRGLTLITPPAGEPLLVQDLKDWLRIPQADTSQDGVIASLLTAARKWIEDAYNRQLVTATWQLSLDRFPRYSSSAVWQYNSDAIWQQRLPVTQLSGQWYPDRAAIRVTRPPLVSVSSITYVDGQGNQQTVSPTVYNVDATTEPGRIAPAYGQIWPIVRQQLASVQVTFVAGYGAAATNGASWPGPESIKTALKLLVASWFENREAVAAGTLDCVPLGVQSILMSVWPGEYE